MLPDPSALRDAATALAAQAGELGDGAARGAAAREATRWAAPLVDELRRALAQAEADGRSGALALAAGAAHLRSLAELVEELRTRTARLQAAAQEYWQQALAAAPPGPVADEARQALAGLPAADDPFWAQAAGVLPVAVPEPAVLRPVAVPPSPPGRVEADVAGLRHLATVSYGCAGVAGAAAAGAAARTADLDLALLDAYDLAGSRSATWLAGLTGSGSPVRRSQSEWQVAGRRVDLLAGLLDTSDQPCELVADPRLGLALGVLEALPQGHLGVQRVLAGVSPRDRRWLEDVVPGAREPTPTGPGWLSRHVPAWLHLSRLDEVQTLVDLWLVPGEMAERLVAHSRELARAAGDLRQAARGLTGDAARAAHGAARETVAAARALRRQSRKVEELGEALHAPGWLRGLGDTPALDVPLLRGVSRLGVVGAVVGLAMDLHSGDSVPLALTKAVLNAAVGVAVAAAFSGVVIGGSVVATVLVALVVGVVVGLAVSALVDRFGPPVGRALQRAGSAAGRAAEDLFGWARRRLEPRDRRTRVLAADRTARPARGGSGGRPAVA